MNIYAIIDLVKHCKKLDLRMVTREDVLSYFDSLKKASSQMKTGIAFQTTEMKAAQKDIIQLKMTKQENVIQILNVLANIMSW